VDSYIDHYRPWCDVLFSKKAGDPGRRDYQCRPAGDFCEIFCFGVGNGHGCVLLQQEPGQRISDEIGSSDNHGVDSLEPNAFSLQQGDHAKRGAGSQSVQVSGETASAGRCESIDIFLPGDAVDEGFGVQVAWQWKLKQDSGNCRIGSQFIQNTGYLFLRRVGRQSAVVIIDPCLLREPTFAADVDFRGRVISYEDGREPNGAAGGALELFDLEAELFSDTRCEVFAVNDV
jgi:hypothetical protein